MTPVSFDLAYCLEYLDDPLNLPIRLVQITFDLLWTNRPNLSGGLIVAGWIAIITFIVMISLVSYFIGHSVQKYFWPSNIIELDEKSWTCERYSLVRSKVTGGEMNTKECVRYVRQ